MGSYCTNAGRIYTDLICSKSSLIRPVSVGAFTKGTSLYSVIGFHLPVAFCSPHEFSYKSRLRPSHREPSRHLSSVGQSVSGSADSVIVAFFSLSIGRYMLGQCTALATSSLSTGSCMLGQCTTPATFNLLCVASHRLPLKKTAVTSE